MTLPKVHALVQPSRGMQELVPEFKAVNTINDASADELAIAARAKLDRKLKVKLRNFDLGASSRVIDIKSSSGVQFLRTIQRSRLTAYLSLAPFGKSASSLRMLEN